MKSSLNHYIKWALFLLLSLVIASVWLKQKTIQYHYSKGNITSVGNQDAIKKERWDAMAQEVSSWGDALGKGIDPQIKDTVIVLNLLGFKTQQSCEGHIDWGLPYPWIDFDTEDTRADALQNKRQDIINQMTQEESDIQKNNPDLSPIEALRKHVTQKLKDLYSQIHLVNDEMDKLSMLKLVPLNNLITEFYKDHAIDRDRMLIFAPFKRLNSFGGEFQITRDESEKLKKLKEYQEEMKSFTAFLIDHYYR